METRAHYVVVGAVSIFVTLAIVGFLLWLGGGALGRDTAVYNVVFDDPPRGLQRGAEVQYNAIRVGEVLETIPDPRDPANKVVAVIEIRAEVPLKTDSEAQLEPSGLTGLSYIQLYAGSEDADVLEPGGRINSRPALIEKFAAGGQEALVRLNSLFSDENVAVISKTFANIEVITANLAEITSRVEGDEALMDKTFGALDAVTDAANAVTQVSNDASELAGIFNAFIEGEATQAMVDVSESAIMFYDASEDGIETIEMTQNVLAQLQGETLSELGLAVEDLRGLADSAERIARGIEDDPARFIKGENRREVTLGPR